MQFVSQKRNRSGPMLRLFDFDVDPPRLISSHMTSPSEHDGASSSQWAGDAVGSAEHNPTAVQALRSQVAVDTFAIPPSQSNLFDATTTAQLASARFPFMEWTPTQSYLSVPHSRKDEKLDYDHGSDDSPLPRTLSSRSYLTVPQAHKDEKSEYEYGSDDPSLPVTRSNRRKSAGKSCEVRQAGC